MHPIQEICEETLKWQILILKKKLACRYGSRNLVEVGTKKDEVFTTAFEGRVFISLHIRSM